MRITTSRFGTIEIDKKKIINFPEGLIGFSNFKKYVILNTFKKNSPFLWLQSLDDGNLAFVIMQPLSFMFKYGLVINDEDQEFIGLTNIKDVIIYVIVCVPHNLQEMTVNLRGPLIINSVNKQGRQIISLDPRYSTKTKILDELNKV